MAKAALGLRRPVPAAQWPRLGHQPAANTALAAQIRACYEAKFWNIMNINELRNKGVAG
ncbi:hypothetical protein GCM10027422_43550 [Hymenobacter arcticus]